MPDSPQQQLEDLTEAKFTQKMVEFDEELEKIRLTAVQRWLNKQNSK